MIKMRGQWTGLLVAGLVSTRVLHAQIYVTNIGDNTGNSGSIAEYPIAGGAGNASLVSGIKPVYGIAVSGSDLFVTSGGKIAEYTTSGVTVTSSLVSGLKGTNAIASSGSDLFVTQTFSNGTAEISEYNTSGAVVNPPIALPNGSDPLSIAVSGSNIFVLDYATGTIGEYTTSGATVNAALITDAYEPICIAASGTDIFVYNGGDGYVFDYNMAGTLVKTNLLSASLPINALAVAGSDLFVLSQYVGSGTVGEYTTAGSEVNASLVPTITGNLEGMAVVAAPATDFLGGTSVGTNLSESPWLGYYTTGSFPLIYQYNLGYEYAYDAGGGGVYLYDYTSGHFWYTSASYYPFVYDFTLQAYLYYYSGNGNPRYFQDYATTPSHVISE